MAQQNNSYVVGDPIGGKAVVAAGKCQLGTEWSTCKLVKKVVVSEDTRVFTFELGDKKKPLNLSTCACILAKLGDVVRPYTPVSTNAMVGKFECMIKVYSNGKFTTQLDALPINSEVEFKHIDVNVKIQYPFKKATIAMIVGGTGITPMIQALHAILGTGGDNTKVKMLYGSRDSKNILGKAFLDKWAKSHSNQLTIKHVLSEEPEDSDWTGERGMIDAELIEKFFPGPKSDVKIFICGPPPMYKALTGARDEKELTGACAELGYTAEQVFKF